MPNSKQLNIGMVGYGFMARAHSNAWANVAHFFDTGYRPVLKAAAARNESKLRHFAGMWGYESIESDWRTLIARKDIDAVDICVPNDMHAQIAIAAAEAGKMVLCEKPLARSEAEGKPMVAAVEKAGVPNMVWYNYRRVPAVSLVKELVAKGKIGKVFHYRAKFLQDWTISPDVPQGGAATWRLDVDAAGSGVTGDRIAHCLDTAMWINGGISSLTAMTAATRRNRTRTSLPRNGARSRATSLPQTETTTGGRPPKGRVASAISPEGIQCAWRTSLSWASRRALQ